MRATTRALAAVKIASLRYGGRPDGPGKRMTLNWTDRLTAIGLSSAEAASRKAAVMRGIRDAEAAWWVPGRIEFLGKHTDYAGWAQPVVRHRARLLHWRHPQWQRGDRASRRRDRGANQQCVYGGGDQPARAQLRPAEGRARGALERPAGRRRTEQLQRARCRARRGVDPAQPPSRNAAVARSASRRGRAGGIPELRWRTGSTSARLPATAVWAR